MQRLLVEDRIGRSRETRGLTIGKLRFPVNSESTVPSLSLPHHPKKLALNRFLLARFQTDWLMQTELYLTSNHHSTEGPSLSRTRAKPDSYTS